MFLKYIMLETIYEEEKELEITIKVALLLFFINLISQSCLFCCLCFTTSQQFKMIEKIKNNYK